MVSVLDFGALGNGVDDDAHAFQTALDSGADVIVPATRAFYKIGQPLKLRRAAQRVAGFGNRSRLVYTGGIPGNLLETHYEDCAFLDLHLTPGATPQHLFDGWAIAIMGAKRVRVSGCRMSEMRRGGVLIADSNDCRVTDNLFVDSLVKGDGSEKQSVTGYDVLMAGTASYNIVSDNQCLSGVGAAIGCQTVTPGKSQRSNLIRGNVIRGYPCYGIMAYLSDPADRVDAITIEGNHIEAISGAIETDGRTRFYGCGIYVQTSNDFSIIGNRITGTNLDRRLPFSGSGVPAAIGISGYGNGVVIGNMIDGCHHGIASIQTTAPPRPGDGAIIADNIVRNCDGAGVYLADGVAANVHDNRLTGSAGATHGVLVKQFTSTWMGDFAVRGNEIRDFPVGIEVSGAPVPHAEIAGNRISGNSGSAIHSSATTSLIHHNSCDGAFGITLSRDAIRGLCRDNVVKASTLAITDDGGGTLLVTDNIILAVEAASYSTNFARTLRREAVPSVRGKRWFRKVEEGRITNFRDGYEGQVITVLADAPFVIRHGAISLRAGADQLIARGRAVSFLRVEGGWREID